VTQTDLNPQEDSFELLKKYTFMFFVSFFFLMFLIKRDFFYLVLGVVSLITLLTFYIPHKKICVKQGAPLFILPTETSTMSTKINTQLETMLLGEHENYKKVEYEKGLIGWIKDEDICNN
jgi:energy-coupling factor transporter transmembrane protein EcfT